MNAFAEGPLREKRKKIFSKKTCKNEKYVI